MSCDEHNNSWTDMKISFTFSIVIKLHGSKVYLPFLSWHNVNNFTVTCWTFDRLTSKIFKGTSFTSLHIKADFYKVSSLAHTPQQKNNPLICISISLLSKKGCLDSGYACYSCITALDNRRSPSSNKKRITPNHNISTFVTTWLAAKCK